MKYIDSERHLYELILRASWDISEIGFVERSTQKIQNRPNEG